MPAIEVILDQDHAVVGQRMGLDRLPVIHTTADWAVHALEHGMASGATSLMVMIPALVDGHEVVVVAETSLNCWMMASAALAAAHRDEVEQPGWAVVTPETKALLIPRYVEALRRAVPGITFDQATETAEMLIDGWSAGAPPEAFE